MDIADQAAEREEQFTSYALSQKQPEGPAYTGYCLNCEEPLPHPKRWCDNECAADWYKRVTLQKQNGGLL